MKTIKLFALLFMLTQCGHKKNEQNKAEINTPSVISKKKYITLGVPNMAFYSEYEPLVRCLNKRLKISHLRIVSALSFDDFEGNVKKKQYDITVVNGLMALQAANNGYTIRAKFSNDSAYYGVIFAKKGSRLRSFNDLKGKTLALTGKSALFGEIAPLVMINKNGLDINKDFKRAFFPSFESAILNVFLGKCEVGAAWFTNWRSFIAGHPQVKENLEVVWRTPGYSNLAIVTRNDMDTMVSAEIIRELLGLYDNVDGKKILDETLSGRIESANSNMYKHMLSLEKEYDLITSRVLAKK